MNSTTRLVAALTWLLMISSYDEPPPPHNFPSSPSDIYPLDESIGFKCSSNKTISVHMVCDKKRDCMDHSDEIYCIHQSVPLKANGTFGNGEKICTQVANYCSCVQVTVTLDDDGEELYELLKSIVEENVTSNSNENITEKSTAQENSTSKSNANITEKPNVEEHDTRISAIMSPFFLLVVVGLIVAVSVYFKHFRKPKTDTPTQKDEGTELPIIVSTKGTPGEHLLANPPNDSSQTAEDTLKN